MKGISVIVLLFVFSAFQQKAGAQSLELAIKQTTNEQYESAEETFKKLLNADPNNGQVYFYFGENYFLQGNDKKAEEMYMKGINLNATDPLCYIGIGKLKWRSKKEAEAKSSFYKALSLSKEKNIAVLTKIAENYITAENKDIEEAMKLLNKAIKLDENYPEIYILMGDAFLEQNNGTEAIKNYNKAAELDKNSAKATLRIGKLYNRARNYNLALDYYKQATEKDPSFAPAYREKAEIYFRAGQYQNAVEQFEKFLELNNNLSARIRFTGFLYQAKKYEDAIKQGSEVFSNDSSNVYLYRYLGYSYFENKQYAEGLKKMEGFFKNAQKDESVNVISQDYEYYGNLLLQSGQDSLGLLNLRKAIEMDSTREDLYNTLGKAYYNNKDYDNAIAMYLKKISLSDKKSPNDHFALGRAYYYSKQFGKADTAFAVITETNPELPLGYLWRARANAQTDPENKEWLAKPHYETYITKVAPEKESKESRGMIEANTYMGVFYINKEDYKKAKEYFLKVKELDPENDNANKFLSSPEASK